MMQKLADLYGSYVDTFRDASGTLPDMMQLKYVHTAEVVRNAELIADGEGFDPEARRLSIAAALLHDTGRYEQLRKYNTFRDADSVDHAVFSHEIVSSNGWLEKAGFSEREVKVVLDAVLFHNRRELPEGLSPLALAASQTVRDADKLDIFRVLEDQVTHCDWRGDSRAFWGLKVGVPPSVEVISAIREGRPVDYQYIRSLADFVLLQIGWMISGLCYQTSRRLCYERGHLEFRRRFLGEIGGGRESEELCDSVKLI